MKNVIFIGTIFISLNLVASDPSQFISLNLVARDPSQTAIQYLEPIPVPINPVPVKKMNFENASARSLFPELDEKTAQRCKELLNAAPPRSRITIYPFRTTTRVDIAVYDEHGQLIDKTTYTLEK